MTARSGQNLQSLIDRVKRATETRERRESLAKFLGVSLVRIYQWLALDRAPNGEVTLLMLEWVTAEEANKTKATGSVSTTTSDKARSTKSDYEKRKARPRQK